MRTDVSRTLAAAVLGTLLVAGCGAPAPDRAVEAPAPSWGEEDWGRFSSSVRWALDARLDTLPLGEAMARLGERWVGTPYVPKTLDPEGPERLVVNFRGLDCVTFVENVFATARFVREEGGALLERRGEAEDRYEALLTELRYREGRLEGYPSRLHYFSEWIRDGERKGLVREITAELGGVADPEPIDFMTSHPEAYAQLADPANLERVRSTEAELSAAGRRFLPEDRIAAAAGSIRNGDIIAATSTVRGLDVAHTGLALWREGRLHLLHAPLVGEAVEISEVSLAERIQRLSGQDGIMVARPCAERGAC